jgi:hypothetical protein
VIYKCHEDVTEVIQTANAEGAIAAGWQRILGLTPKADVWFCPKHAGDPVLRFLEQRVTGKREGRILE